MTNANNIVKTGTTILGIVCKDGVVMAGDKRATLGGQIIANKDMNKILELNNYSVVAICGHAAEAVKVSKLLSAELKLKQLRSKKRPTIKEVASLLSNIQVQASGFLIAGVDENGEASLHEIIGGLTHKIVDFSASIGSGMPYVLGLLERQYKKGLTIEEGIELAKESLKSSTQRDPASGDGIDIYTITKDGIKKAVSQVIEPNFKDQ